MKRLKCSKGILFLLLLIDQVFKDFNLPEDGEDKKKKPAKEAEESDEEDESPGKQSSDEEDLFPADESNHVVDLAEEDEGSEPEPLAEGQDGGNVPEELGEDDGENGPEKLNRGVGFQTSASNEDQSGGRIGYADPPPMPPVRREAFQTPAEMEERAESNNVELRKHKRIVSEHFRQLKVSVLASIKMFNDHNVS